MHITKSPSKGHQQGLSAMLCQTKMRTLVLVILLGAMGAALHKKRHQILDSLSASGPTTTTSSSTNIAVVDSNENEPETVIHFIGERHTGTKWMREHLYRCFAYKSDKIRVVAELSRWKHWFQENGAYSTKDAIVVAQFRHINHWVEAMRLSPYHSPNHFNLSWHDFVTKPWTMERFGQEQEIFETDRASIEKQWNEPICQHFYRPSQIIPCFGNESVNVPGHRIVTPLYELRNDGSSLPYDSILQMRADKIRNFLDIANFDRVRHLEVVRYEEMVVNGTAPLIRQLEKVLGVKAKCQPTEPQVMRSRPLSQDYVDWMRENVDWDTERLVGYEPE